MTDLVAEPQAANLLEARQLLATDGYQGGLSDLRSDFHL